MLPPADAKVAGVMDSMKWRVRALLDGREGGESCHVMECSHPVDHADYAMEWRNGCVWSSNRRHGFGATKPSASSLRMAARSFDGSTSMLGSWP